MSPRPIFHVYGGKVGAGRPPSHLSGVATQHVSNAILFEDAKDERDANKGIMELESGIRASPLCETRDVYRSHRDAVVRRLLNAGEMSEFGDDFHRTSPSRGRPKHGGFRRSSSQDANPEIVLVTMRLNFFLRLWR